MKVSRRDLSACIANHKLGATTVAGTMIAAHMAGIRIFATGGIGGVHRGAERDFDVSADLEELARTPVAVVCSSAKSILDLPKTLEVLETKGVPVCGWRTDEFPAFYCRSSGLPVPLRCDTVEVHGAGPRGAKTARPRRWCVDRQPGTRGCSAAGRADRRSDPRGAAGRGISRHRRQGRDALLLARIVELTKGESADTDVALVLSNARLAAKLAVALQALQGQSKARVA